MGLTTTAFLAFEIVLFAIIVVLVFRHCMGPSWEQEVSADFTTALSRFDIENHEILVERNVPPARYVQGEVYRVLHTHHGQYFLYLYTPGSPGVIQSLSEERALRAVRLNG